MSINLLNTDIGKEFSVLQSQTNSSIYIMSPFISYQTANQLSSWLDKPENKNVIDCKIITRFNREEFVQGASSIQGLKRLKEAGASLYALQHLHTKLYIFDGENTIMGSANFTISGFFKNHELGIIVKEEPDFNKKCVDYFSDILYKIHEYEIDMNRILEEQSSITEATSCLGELRKSKQPNKKQARWGAVIDKEENDRQKSSNYSYSKHFDILNETTYDEDSGVDARIKFEGSSKQRVPNDEVYLERKKLHYDTLNRAFFSRRPISFKDGDRIFLAVLSKDKKGKKTSIIVGYATALAYKEGNIVRKGDSNFKEWNENYPYYIEYKDGRFLKGPIGEGITMTELCTNVGNKTYPSTNMNPQTNILKLLRNHHTKPHIRITSHASRYLTARLEELFEEFGYDKI